MLAGRLASSRVASGRFAMADLLAGRLASGRLASGRFARAYLLAGRLASGRLASDRLARGIFASWQIFKKILLIFFHPKLNFEKF